MLEVHKQGKAIAGIYDYQIAESKIYDVTESAREHNFPLKVTGEPE
jgi:ATP-dependent Clp protease adaptor protein ClpS